MKNSQLQLESDLQALRGLPVFISYNANVDAIVRVGADLEAYLDRPPEPGKRTPPSRLASKRELATAITRTMVTPGGDEIAMTDELAATLESELEPNAQQMGGQAGIMTNLLSSLGAAPIMYTYLLSVRQQSMFDHPNAVRYPIVDDGEVQFVPLDEIVNTERTKINWVFEFGVDDDLFGVQSVEDSRFIAASRPPEFDLITGDLDEVIDQIGAVVDGALLSGYHNLTPENVEDGYERTQRHAREVIRRLRSGSELKVHIEYAVTHDADLRESIYEWILPEADVVGMDAHELQLLTEDAGLDGADDAPSEETPFEVAEILTHYRLLSELRKKLGVDCLRLHAMEYHLSVIDDYLPPEAVKRGLEFAAVNAATKADRGQITSPGDLESGLAYEPSTAGKEAIALLAAHVDATIDDGACCTPTVVACPNRVVADPTGTVGIGDIVSSSSFALELAVATDRA